MGIDFGVLRNDPGLMAAVLLGFLAIKLIFVYGIALAMKLPLQERPVFAVLLAQGGEFAFVVFHSVSISIRSVVAMACRATALSAPSRLISY